VDKTGTSRTGTFSGMAQLEQTTSAGWEVLRLTSDALVAEVVPALGGTVISVRRRAGDVEMLWRSPWGLRAHGAATLPGSDEAKMVDALVGGWQTVFPNGGDTVSEYGTTWGFDGEARLAPFSWQSAGSSVIMTSRLVRSPFLVTKVISLHDVELTLGETIKNVGGEAVEVMWGSQIILGPPLLAAGSVVEAPGPIVRADPQYATDAGYDDLLPWPRSYGRDGMVNLRALPGLSDRETRMAYLSDFGAPRVSVLNRAARLGVTLEWDAEAWPYLWYAVEAGRRSGFPWFSAGYHLALTPSSSWPAHGLAEARRISQSTLLVLPGVAHTSHLTLRVHPPD
jgi:hypothetical protein